MTTLSTPSSSSAAGEKLLEHLRLGAGLEYDERADVEDRAVCALHGLQRDRLGDHDPGRDEDERAGAKVGLLVEGR